MPEKSFAQLGILMYLHDLFEIVINVNEVFDTKISPDKWEQRNNQLVGTLSIDQTTYEIYLEPADYSIKDKTFNIINVAFAKIVNEQPDRNLSLNNKSASKIFGAIINALLEKIKQFEYDAIVFIARDNIEKRMSLYNQIARHKGGNFLSQKENITIPGGQATVLYNKNFPQEYREHLNNKLN